MISLPFDVWLNSLSAVVLVSKTQTRLHHYYKGVLIRIEDNILQIIGTNGALLAVCKENIEVNEPVKYSTVLSLPFVEMMISVLKNIKRSHNESISKWRKMSKLSRGECPCKPLVEFYPCDHHKSFFSHSFGISNIEEVPGYKDFSWVKGLSDLSHSSKKSECKSFTINPYFLMRIMNVFAAYRGGNSVLYNSSILHCDFVEELKISSIKSDKTIHFYLDDYNISVFTSMIKKES